MHLVMFDIDGTLVDSNGFDGALFARAVREELGVPVDTTWQSYRHVTDSGVLEELLCAPWDLVASIELGYNFVCIGDSVEHAPRFADFRDRQRVLAALGRR